MPDPRETRAVTSARTLTRRIGEPELDLVPALRFTNLVNRRLCGKYRLRHAGRPVRSGPRLVDYDVVAVDTRVGDVVAREHRARSHAHPRAGVCARFVLQVRLRRVDQAVVGHADLDADLRRPCWTRGFQHVAHIHDDPHRTAGVT